VPDDLYWLLRELESQQSPKDRELVLKLALDLWNESGRPRRGRQLIQSSIQGDASLTRIFRQTLAGRSFLRLETNWLRTMRFHLGDRWWWNRQIRSLRSRWGWLREQWIFLTHIHRLMSGKRIDWLRYLIHEAASKESSRWAPDSWRELRSKRGRIITWAAKRGCKRLWRSFEPLLPHEKPKPNETDIRVIVGLAGLGAAIQDRELELASLSVKEARAAARYAVNELNGFAPWMFDLARSHAMQVQEILTICVEGEWKNYRKQDLANGVISHLVYQGHDLDELVSSTFWNLLCSGDPENSTILRHSLAILLRQESLNITELSTLCASRLNPPPSEMPSRILWLAVWLQCDPDGAIDSLEQMINDSSDTEQMLIELCSSLSVWLPEAFPRMQNPSYAAAAHLRRLIPIVYTYVKPEEDINRARTGAYTPGARDHAQDFRNSLMPMLSNSEGADVVRLLRELKEEPAMDSLRDWLAHLIRQREEHDADLIPWKPENVRQFQAEFESDPRTDADLFEIVLRRLSDIKHDVEKTDVSIRQDLHSGQDELRFRRWLTHQLKVRAKERYTVSQEEEVDLQQRPDVRIWNPHVSGGPVSFELKLADRWSYAELSEGLENQLIMQYMRDRNARYGVYLLGYTGNKSYWREPGSWRKLLFEDLIATLQRGAAAIVAGLSDALSVRVIGIDFRDPRQGRK
jgi:hypothetical protein